MSQFGMQMPGAQRARKARMNVYTAIMFCAVLALLTANAIAYLNGSIIAPKDAGAMGPLTIHEKGRVSIAN